MIATLGLQHVLEVASLHCQSLTGLLTQLGLRAVRAYYRGCAKSPAAVGLVFLQNQQVVGFVLGSASPDQLKRDVLRRNPWGTATGILLGMVRRPAAAIYLVKSLTGPPEASYDSHCAELTYLAVSPKSRGAGVGKRLVDAFGKALSEKGARTYELSVDSDNHAAIRFYEKAGFRLVGEYREFGVTRRRYRLSIE